MASTIRHISTLSTPKADAASAHLTPAQAQVVRSLAAGRSVSAAAREAGLHRSTIHNWLNQSPAFSEAVRQARQDFQNELSDQLLELSAAALESLRGLLSNPETPPAVRLRAALAILDRPLPAPAGFDETNPIAPAAAPATAQPISRSAPCPCGSGLKYKRCCGRNAPPVLNGPLTEPGLNVPALNEPGLMPAAS